MWTVLAIIVLQFMAAWDGNPDPRLFVRLVGVVQGLGLDDPSVSPVFQLAVDVDMIKEEFMFQGQPIHAGGGDARLRVSYRGVILAWGSVPRFVIRHKLLGRSAANVATVVAKAEGSVVREEMRNLIRAELRALGRAEFDVEGELPGFAGRLHCKTYLFEDEPTEGLPPCWFQEKSE